MPSINLFLQKHDIDKSDIGIYKTLYKFYCLTASLALLNQRLHSSLFPEAE